LKPRAVVIHQNAIEKCHHIFHKKNYLLCKDSFF
jgi:hypothetical protein